jgi:hypothetical protein
MLGEKEEIKRIKASLKAGRTKEQIANALMAKGYKYDYVSVLMKKASFGKQFLIGFLVGFVILLLLGWAVYGNFFVVKDIQLNITNPLAGLKILSSDDGEVLIEPDNYTGELAIDEIEITPEFITYLLGLIEAQNYLHKIPLTNNVPIINFEIGDKSFNAVVDRGVEAYEGLSDSADLKFDISQEVVVLTTVADDPKDEFLSAVDSGEVQIEMLVGETELFSKGYLGFYNSLTA